jgi:DNA-binding CsgD family transcriptional regulator
MKQDVIASLSPMQKICLRQVYAHRQSKEIARQLGLSHYTVESHIKSARARLGASNRFEAARMLIAEEGEGPPSPSVSLPIGIPIAASSAPSLTPDEIVGPAKIDESRNTPWGSETRLYKVLPLPRYWGEKNDLNIAQRLWWMFALTVMICLSLGAVMTSLQALASLF